MAVRDKEWLTLEACREFQRGTCSRTDQECKYAHPSNTVVVENGRVIACYDSMKGQCTRENCRYLHPPPHLKTQLEIKGQNNIAARRMLQNAALQNQLLAAQPGSIPIQPTILSAVPTTLPSGTSPVAATTSQANVDAAAATATAYHYHGHHPYMIPVAVTMAPTMSHSTLSQHMYPASYLSQAVQTLPTVPTSTTVPGTGTTAHPGFSEIPIQAPIIPSAPGAPFQFFPVKTKNDRLEMWNYLKDDSARWQGPSEYNNYIQNHQSLSACLPRPAKMPAPFPQPPLAQSPIYHPSNLLYNPLAPMTVMTQPQFLPAPLPMMPAPFPFLAPHILQSQNTSETLPVCRDFKSGNCKRPNCKYAHVMEDYVEITDGKVTVCRYAVQNRCTRPRCKFYHPPTTAPVAVVNSIPQMPTPGVTNA